MKTMCSTSLLLLAALISPTSAAGASPVAKVIQLLTDLQAKITNEGKEATLTYQKYSEMCETRAAELANEIKTGRAEVADLMAGIQEAASKMQEYSARIDDETGNVQTEEADLTAALDIRAKETADFQKTEKELTEVVAMLEKAIAILTREMQKHGGALLQVQKVPEVMAAIKVILDSTALDSQDSARLAALVQSSHGEGNDDSALGAPDGAVYESHSGSIIDTLQELMSKASDQLDSARKAEVDAAHKFGMLKQSLVDSIAVATKCIGDSKKELAENTGLKATKESDLAVTSKGLADAKDALSDLERECMDAVRDFETSKGGRAEELNALAMAKKHVVDKTGAASDLVHGASFLQLQRAGLRTGADLANFEVVRFVRSLAKKQHSEAIALLARRMATVVQTGALGGADPFGKVKGLISDMIAKLEKDADADATQKAYCDKEMSETATKLDEKNAEYQKLTSKIDSDTAHAAKLKEQIADLQKSLAALARTQAAMTKLRAEEKKEYTVSKADTELGIEGVKMALKVLRDYYQSSGGASSSTAGSGHGIIGLLEVIESDFAKMLAELDSTESARATGYDTETKDNDIERTHKEDAVKFKTKESKQLDMAVNEDSTDRSSVQTELSAVQEYQDKVTKTCVEKAESYSERSRRLEAEIAGLKEALSILENETALLERGAKRSRHSPHSRRGLRGGAFLAA